MMMRLVIIPLCTVMLFCIGCQESASTVSLGGSARSETDDLTGLIDYLYSRELPALQSVQRWSNEYGPGLKISTDHYDVYTTWTEPLVLGQVPGFVESCYRGYNRQLPDPIETQTRMTMYLFENRDQWAAFTKKFTGPQAPVYLKLKVGAYYLNGACVAFNAGRERTFSTIGHEGWHQFNSRHFRYRLPSWLDEGIAMLFETTQYEDGFFVFESGRNLQRLGSLKRAIQSNRMIPLQDLIALNPGELLTIYEGGNMAAFYAQAYALVRFLREDDYGKRLGRYHRMLMDGLQGRWPLGERERIIAADRNIPLTVGWNRAVGRKLFEVYIGEDIRAIEQEYLAFCRKITYRVRLK